MRQIRFYFLIIIAITWFLVLVPYFLAQTSYGAKIISEQLSRRSPYIISIRNIHHSIKHPFEVTFDHLIIKKKANGQQSLVQDIANIDQLVIGVDRKNPWQLTHFDYITIINGLVNTPAQTEKDLTANTLKLINSTINFTFESDVFSLQSVNGGIKPFNFTGEPYQFDLTSQTILFNGFPLKSVLIQGFQQDGSINLTNVGGNIHNGFFVGKLSILPNNHLDISQLKVNNINVQSDIELDDLNEVFGILPDINIHQFSLIDSSLSLPGMSIEKGNIEATDLSYNDGWHLNQGTLVFNADNLVYHDNLFSSPLIELHSSQDKIAIEKAIATWNKGNINATGSWQNNHLQLDQLLIAGVRYELPTHLNATWLPELFQQITIDHLMMLPSLVFNTDANSPFVFTNFELSGNDVDIRKDNKWGITSGTLFLRAESGTYKGVDIKYPDLSVEFLSDNSSEFNFSTLLNNGLFETMAIIDPTKTQFTTFKINAYNVNSTILTKWQLAQNPPIVDNFSADFHGDISPFSLSGTLSSNENQYSIEPQH